MKTLLAGLFAAAIALPYAAPRGIVPTANTKCDWGAVQSVSPDGHRVVVKTESGLIDLTTQPGEPVVGANDAPAGTVASLQAGQKVRVYYTTGAGAVPEEIDRI